MAEITKEKLLVSTVAQETRLSAMRTKIVSYCHVTPVQFVKALCDEKLRVSLRFGDKNQGGIEQNLNISDEFLGSASSYLLNNNYD